jgi:hypothetical protein
MTEKPKGMPKSKTTIESGCLKWFHLIGLFTLPVAIWYGLKIVRVIFLVLPMIISTVLPPQVVEACEIQISELNSFRTQVMSQGLKPNFLTYEITNDNGNTWVSLYEVRNDSGGLRTNCEVFHIEDETFYWAVPDEGYYPRILFVTHDAGKTWHEWKPSDIAELSGNCIIERVNFYLTNGSMLVECSLYHSSRRYEESQNYNLFTIDGGVTWANAND